MCSLFEKQTRIKRWTLLIFSRQAVEQPHQAGLVRIAHRGFAIRLDPFGMLDPEVVVNLLPELGVGVDLIMRIRWPGERFIGVAGPFVQLGTSVTALHSETNEFHKRLSTPGMIATVHAGRRTTFVRTTHRSLTSDAFKAPDEVVLARTARM